MPGKVVEFPLVMDKGVAVRVPSRPGSAEELILIALAPVSFQDVEELFDYCQYGDHPEIELRINRKAS